MRAEFKRVKHGQIPGDVGRKLKIAMREKQTPIDLGMNWVIGHWVIGDKCAKSFRKGLAAKSRTVQRRRDKKAIKKGLEE